MNADAERIAREIGKPFSGGRVEDYIKLVSGQRLTFKNEVINWANALDKRTFDKLDRRVTDLIEGS